MESKVKYLHAWQEDPTSASLAGRAAGPKMASLLEALLKENPWTEPEVIWCERWTEQGFGGTVDNMAVLVVLRPLQQAPVREPAAAPCLHPRMPEDPQTKAGSLMLLEIRKAIQEHEKKTLDDHRFGAEFRNNETFIVVGLREAESIIMKQPK